MVVGLLCFVLVKNWWISVLFRFGLVDVVGERSSERISVVVRVVVEKLYFIRKFLMLLWGRGLLWELGFVVVIVERCFV